MFYRLAPSWLTSGDGELVLYSLGRVEDEWMERLRQGLNARFPTRAPSDALGAIGQDRRIVKGFVEADATYASRLLRWLDDWKTAGNPFSLMQQVKAYSGATRLRTVDQRGNWFTLDGDDQAYVFDQGNWDWDGLPDTNWSRFWLIIYSETGPWERVEWGTHDWGEAGRTWGSTATPEEVKSIRGIVRDWKPAHAKCVKIIVSFEDDAFDPTDAQPPLPDGTWGRNWKYSGGVVVRTRDDRAIYWGGT